VLSICQSRPVLPRIIHNPVTQLGEACELSDQLPYHAGIPPKLCCFAPVLGEVLDQSRSFGKVNSGLCRFLIPARLETQF
jgi:hypothetical protein